MLDNLEIELELNNTLVQVNAQIKQLEDEAARFGKTAYDYRNQNGDPTIGPLLDIKSRVLHSLMCMRHEH